MSSYESRLRQAIATRSAVFVVGTGVSKSLSGNAPSADWVGLIETGIEMVSVSTQSQPWAETMKQLLEAAIGQSDVDMLISVASQTKAKLQTCGPQTYADWLRDNIGELPLSFPQLGLDLVALGCPILTTNYDSLIEKATGRPSAVWGEQEEFRAILRLDSDAIGHLHGDWKKPDSVILSEADYQRILLDDPTQMLQQAHYTTKQFVFVGYGSGLKDPNFSQLLRWHRKLFPSSRSDHFRLCREDELEDLTAQHSSDDIRVVSFGAAYSDLGAFLQSLAVPEIEARTRDGVAFAREAILDQIRSETVVSDDLKDVEGRELDEITVAPVLLPLPHEQFASGRTLDKDLRPTRIDPAELINSAGIVIIAGDELSGVSTAIRWLVAKAATESGRGAPLFVDSRLCSGGSHPLLKQVKKEALSQRLIDRRGDEVHDYVLAVDNVKPVATHQYSLILDDLVETTARAIYLGVRLGDETQLLEDLRQRGTEARVVYIGKLGTQELEALANILIPDRARDLCDRVLDVIRNEHLPRTPFTACLLLVLLGRGTASAINTSETSVLDKYVQLLLGRNGTFLDPRWTLDPQNREVVLSSLAKAMIRGRRGAFSQADTIAVIEELFAALDWPEDPIATLESFRRMRLVRVQNDVVQFQQSSYLHLFGAKAAIDDGAFLDELLQDPLFFAPIIRHYAALVRNSDRVASSILDVLQNDWNTDEPKGRAFQLLEAVPAPTIKENGPPRDARSSLSEPDAEEYDYSDDADRVPFPLDDPSGWNRTQQLMWVLDLASRIVRDSDQIANLDLKNTLLEAVLVRWGYLLDLLVIEGTFDEAAEGLIDLFEADGGIKDGDRDDVLAAFQLMLPAFVLLSGVSGTLTSRKLLRTFERVSQNALLKETEFGAVASAFFAFDLGHSGWTSHFPDLAEKFGRTWVVSDFIYFLARMAYRYQVLSSEDEEALRVFLKRRGSQRYSFDSSAAEKRWLGDFDQILRRDRRLHQRDRYAEGHSVIDALDSEAS